MADSIKNQKAPILRRKIQGRKKYCWRSCPYSTASADHRIPDIEKSIHTTTSGKMELDVRGGYDVAGFLCTDPLCSFYLGTATTPITIKIRNFTISGGEYFNDFKTHLITPCSGSRFFEI